jgi:hypothetical protein
MRPERILEIGQTEFALCEGGCEALPPSAAAGPGQQFGQGGGGAKTRVGAERLTGGMAQVTEGGGEDAGRGLALRQADGDGLIEGSGGRQIGFVEVDLERPLQRVDQGTSGDAPPRPT